MSKLKTRKAKQKKEPTFNVKTVYFFMEKNQEEIKFDTIYKL